MTDSTLASYIDDAAQIDGNFQERVQQISGDRNLSPEGKAQAIADARGKRDTVLADIRGKAQRYAEAEQQRLEKKLDQARRAAATKRRETLGDVLTVDILRAELATMEPSDIVAAVVDAPDEWHQTALLAWANIELRKREGMEAAVAVAELRGLNLDEGLRDAELALRDFRIDAQRLERLDPDAYRRGIADTLGVRAEYVTIN